MIGKLARLTAPASANGGHGNDRPTFTPFVGLTGPVSRGILAGAQLSRALCFLEYANNDI